MEVELEGEEEKEEEENEVEEDWEGKEENKKGEGKEGEGAEELMMGEDVKEEEKVVWEAAVEREMVMRLVGDDR